MHSDIHCTCVRYVAQVSQLATATAAPRPAIAVIHLPYVYHFGIDIRKYVFIYLIKEIHTQTIGSTFFNITGSLFCNTSETTIFLKGEQKRK